MYLNKSRDSQFDVTKSIEHETRNRGLQRSPQSPWCGRCRTLFIGYQRWGLQGQDIKSPQCRACTSMTETRSDWIPLSKKVACSGLRQISNLLHKDRSVILSTGKRTTRPYSSDCDTSLFLAVVFCAGMYTDGLNGAFHPAVKFIQNRAWIVTAAQVLLPRRWHTSPNRQQCRRTTFCQTPSIDRFRPMKLKGIWHSDWKPLGLLKNLLVNAQESISC